MAVIAGFVFSNIAALACVTGLEILPSSSVWWRKGAHPLMTIGNTFADTDHGQIQCRQLRHCLGRAGFAVGLSSRFASAAIQSIICQAILGKMAKWDRQAS
jgi:hypothetical protein